MRLFNSHRVAGPAVALALLAATACDQDDAVVDVTGDHLIFNFETGIAGGALPDGDAALEIAAILNFDLTPPDAFNRGTGALGRYIPIQTPFGAASGFNMGDAVRNSSQDPRLPALVESDGAVLGFLGLFNPQFTGQGAGIWDLFGQVQGLKPNTTYTIVLARMALQVNGELDQAQIMTGEAVDEPDSLYYLGGSEGGSGAVTCDFSAAVTVNDVRNPVALGVITTNGAGAAGIDCVPLAAASSPWWKSDAAATPPGAADSTAVGVNDVGGTVRPGQYNYMLVFEGQDTTAATGPVPAGNPTLRVQIGPDIDANGDAIDETYAPFPLGVVNPTGLPGAVNAIVVPSAVNLVNVTNLPQLFGGVMYQAYLINPHTGEAVAAGDPFNTEGVDDVYSLSITEDSVGATVDEFGMVAISVQAPGATTTPTAPFLAFTYLDHRNNAEPTDNIVTLNGDLIFGTPSGLSVTPFARAGTGLGRIKNDSILVELRDLNAPPPGWRYQAWLAVQTNEVVDPASVVMVDQTVALDAEGDATIWIGGVDITQYNTFLLTLGPLDQNYPGPFFVQVSEDYKAKFPDFFD